MDSIMASESTNSSIGETSKGEMGEDLFSTGLCVPRLQ